MKENTTARAADQTPAQIPNVVLFAEYKGHRIDVQACGHPQCQNIYIDGKSAGYVVFPNGAITTARGIIDARAAIAKTEGRQP